jgi:hypothetical protein
MKYITLDFETYYDKDFSLSKITTEEYIRGKQFEAIGVATKVDDGPIVWVSGTYKELKAHLDSLPWGDHLLLAQNTAFDAAILNWRFGIKPAGYLDTMSWAAPVPRPIDAIMNGGNVRYQWDEATVNWMPVQNQT